MVSLGQRDLASSINLARRSRCLRIVQICSRFVAQASQFHVKDRLGGEKRDSVDNSLMRRPPMMQQTARDRTNPAPSSPKSQRYETTSRQGRGTKSRLGAEADKARFHPRAQPLPLYRAARPRPHRPAIPARGARPVVARPQRSHVAPTLDALLTTLNRLTGEVGAGYPAPGSPRRATRNSRPKPTACSATGQRTGLGCGSWRPCRARRRRNPSSSTAWLAAGMDCARINCAHDDAEIWGQMVEQVHEAAARLKRPCRVLMDIAGPKSASSESRRRRKRG